MEDINTKAYETVKAKWIKFGIWKKTWGFLPGMSWKHEHPLEDLLRVELPEALVLGPLYPPTKPAEADTQTTDAQNGSQLRLLPWELTHEERSKAAERIEQRRRAAAEALLVQEAAAKPPPFSFGAWNASDYPDYPPLFVTAR